LLEYCEQGTLTDVLDKNSEDWDWHKFFKISSGIATGLLSLHNSRPPIVHKELRPNNILITEWKAKFCEFGVSSDRYTEKGRDQELASLTVDENIAYISPELFTSGEHSIKSDIYAVAILLWELVVKITTGQHEVPYHFLNKSKNGAEILRDVSEHHLRPSFPPEFPPALAPIHKLITTCWDENPDKRPTAKNLCDQLRMIENEFKRHQAAWNQTVKKEDAAAKAAEEEKENEKEKGQELTSSDKDKDLPAPAHVEIISASDQEEKLRVEIEKQVMERMNTEREKLRKQMEEESAKRQQAVEELAAKAADEAGNSASSGAGGASNLAEIDYKQIYEQKLLGMGQFGEVWKGLLWGKPVAMKKLKDLTEESLQSFKKEVAIMTTLRHPNICLLIGACTQPGHLRLVMEFCSRGSVEGLVHCPKPVSLEMRIKFLQDCILGMNFLHHMSPPFLHLDLKPGNLLVDDSYNVKVADFGLSGVKTEDGVEAEGGTPYYMPPEALIGREPSEKFDVYAFGIMVWELYCLEAPYKDEKFESQEEFEMAICEDGLRPKIPDSIPSSLRTVITSCWDSDADKRPSFQELSDNRMLERVNCELKITSTEGQDFWKHYFVGEPYATWQEFYTCLITFLKPARSAIPSEADPKLDLLKKVLSDPKSIQDPEPIVTIDNFNNFCSWYGTPLTLPAILDRLFLLGQAPWFHGDVTLKKTEALLMKSKKKAGAFLVRYAARPGDFIVSIMSVKRGKTIFEHQVITKVTGGYVWIPAAEWQGKCNLDPANSIEELLKRDKKVTGVKMNRYVAFVGTSVVNKLTMPQLSKGTGLSSGSTVARRMIPRPSILPEPVTNATGAVAEVKEGILKKYFT